MSTGTEALLVLTVMSMFAVLVFGGARFLLDVGRVLLGGDGSLRAARTAGLLVLAWTLLSRSDRLAQRYATTAPPSRRGPPPWQREAQPPRTPPPTVRRASTPEQSRETVWRALRAACEAADDKPVLVRAVVAATGLSDDLIRIRLRELVREGRAIRHGDGRWTTFEAIGEPSRVVATAYGPRDDSRPRRPDDVDREYWALLDEGRS